MTRAACGRHRLIMAAMVEPSTKSIRGRWRFALSVVFLALAALGGWVAWSAHQVSQRDAMLTEIELAEGSVVFFSDSAGATATQENPPLMWRMFGANEHEVDPVKHLIGGAMLWGGNPEKDRRIPADHAGPG